MQIFTDTDSSFVLHEYFPLDYAAVQSKHLPGKKKQRESSREYNLKVSY